MAPPVERMSELDTLRMEVAALRRAAAEQNLASAQQALGAARHAEKQAREQVWLTYALGPDDTIQVPGGVIVRKATPTPTVPVPAAD